MASDIVVTVSENEETTVTVQETTRNVASTELYNPPALVEGIGNVDASDLRHGSVLVYKTPTRKWTATTKLDAQDVDAGEF